MNKQPEATVSAVIFNTEGKVLLCKSHKWENKYIIPGGHIEFGEKMEDALKREILEETGLDIFDIKLISLKESICNDKFYENRHFIFIDYICKTNSDKVILDEEAEEYIWVGLNDVELYELGGFTKELLIRIRDKENFSEKAEIFYNY